MSKLKPTATMKDVARKAGVSTATVSRALSKPEKLSSRTRLRVEEAVTSCGYMAQRRTVCPEAKVILIVLGAADNPVDNEIVKSIKQIASAHNYIVFVSYDDPQARERYAAHYLTIVRQVCGVIHIGTAAFSHWLNRNGIGFLPQITIGCADYAAGSVAVDIDRFSAAFNAVNYLCRLGYSRIAYLGVNERNEKDYQYQGYKQALQREKIAPEASYILYGENAFSYGAQAIERLIALPTPPNAVYCSNDIVAIGAVQQIKRASLNVPHQLSVIGFGDIASARFCDPPLTTVKYPAEEIGKQAFNTLLDWLRQPAVKPKAHLMEGEIIERYTTIERQY